jgi:phosphoglycolate phosphatase
MDFSKNKKALLSLSKPKAVIFDWDNTLVDTWPLIQTAIDATMEKMGQKAWGLEKVRDNVHKSMRESFPAIFGDKWEEAGEIYKKTYRASHLQQIQLLPNALELLSVLEEKGILLFVVSNKMGVTLRKEAAKLGIDKKFFALIGASDASADKPSKQPVELALLGSDLDPKKDEIWFIGDTITDVECARNSGCQPIVYGHSSCQISKTIPAAILAEEGRAILPVYFDHRELVELF